MHSELFDTFIEDTEPIEDETDLEEILIEDLSSAIVQATDWTTSTILDQIEKGRIQLNPSFQRRDAWTDERKSRFIESLLLGFPIPQLVLAESQRQKGRYIVIDGKQRLLSLVRFAGTNTLSIFKPLKLKGLEILSDLNGKTLNEVRSNSNLADRLEDFENITIRTVVIRHWRREAILYHIFLRLNTGSVQLSAQELRNALNPGPFAEFIDIYSGESPALQRILQTRGPDFRMRDAELLLRYFAFRNLLTEYTGSIKTFLDLTTRKFNDSWDSSEDNIRTQVREFEEAVNTAYTIFGEKDTFRKWKDGYFIGRFNRAVFDIVVFYFWDTEIQTKARANAAEVKQAFIETSASRPDFVGALESTTKSLGATVTRLFLWGEALGKVLSLDLSTPRLVNNRIILRND